MSWEPKSLVLTIAVAGTPVPLSETSLLTKSFAVEADNSNAKAEALYIGDSDVDAISTPTKGHRLAKNEVYGINTECHGEYYDISKWYVDATQSGMKFQFSYLKKD